MGNSHTSGGTAIGTISSSQQQLPPRYIPFDIVSEVMEYLSLANSSCNYSLVSKTWKLAEDYYWKHRVLHHVPADFTKRLHKLLPLYFHLYKVDSYNKKSITHKQVYLLWLKYSLNYIRDAFADYDPKIHGMFYEFLCRKCAFKFPATKETSSSHRVKWRLQISSVLSRDSIECRLENPNRTLWGDLRIKIHCENIATTPRGEGREVFGINENLSCLSTYIEVEGKAYFNNSPTTSNQKDKVDINIYADRVEYVRDIEANVSIDISSKQVKNLTTEQYNYQFQILNSLAKLDQAGPRLNDNIKSMFFGRSPLKVGGSFHRLWPKSMQVDFFQSIRGRIVHATARVTSFQSNQLTVKLLNTITGELSEDVELLIIGKEDLAEMSKHIAIGDCSVNVQQLRELLPHSNPTITFKARIIRLNVYLVYDIHISFVQMLKSRIRSAAKSTIR
jgi:hypothetical protein